MYSTSRPLRFGDCDPSGIAYYPSYLRILDGVIEDFFASLGAPRDRMIDTMRVGTPTLTLDLAFRKPGFNGNELTFEIRVLGIGRSSLDLAHTVSQGDDVLWTARHRLVATSLDNHKSCAWPDQIRAALTDHLEKTNAHDPAA